MTPPTGTHRAVTVRRPEELAAVDALVVPGGESTTMAKLAARFGLLEPLRAVAGTAGPRMTRPGTKRPALALGHPIR